MDYVRREFPRSLEGSAELASRACGPLSTTLVEYLREEWLQGPRFDAQSPTFEYPGSSTKSTAHGPGPSLSPVDVASGVDSAPATRRYGAKYHCVEMGGALFQAFSISLLLKQYEVGVVGTKSGVHLSQNVTVGANV